MLFQTIMVELSPPVGFELLVLRVGVNFQRSAKCRDGDSIIRLIMTLYRKSDSSMRKLINCV